MAWAADAEDAVVGRFIAFLGDSARSGEALGVGSGLPSRYIVITHHRAHWTPAITIEVRYRGIADYAVPARAHRDVGRL